MTFNTPNTMTLKEIRAHLAQQREQALAEQQQHYEEVLRKYEEAQQAGQRAAEDRMALECAIHDMAETYNNK
ncbi:hypothetical protein [Aeromonas caviae]|uniref:hypothetical protein n=1 Tax=Aeromonas caviae TaxID=648 RepID=UPI002B48E685|nr:hypothetical protein [Aeromonas caviae]